MENFELFGNVDKAKDFLKTLKSGRFLFSFVISYTETCEISGITFAGADKNSIRIIGKSAIWEMILITQKADVHISTGYASNRPGAVI